MFDAAHGVLENGVSGLICAEWLSAFPGPNWLKGPVADRGCFTEDKGVTGRGRTLVNRSGGLKACPGLGPCPKTCPGDGILRATLGIRAGVGKFWMTFDGQGTPGAACGILGIDGG